MKEKEDKLISEKIKKSLPMPFQILYGVIALSAVVFCFWYAHHFLMEEAQIPNLEAMKKNESQEIIYDSPDLPSGTYCTIRSNDLDGIPIYEQAGDQQYIAFVPEGRYVEFLKSATAYGKEWVKIAYCDLTGWLPKKHVRYISKDKKYIEKGSRIYVNSDAVLGIKAYAEPSSNGEVVLSGLQYGDEFTVEEIQHGWGKIIVEEGEKPCWLNMYHMGNYGGNEWEVLIFGQSEGLNLRNKPSSEGKSIHKIPNHTVLHIKEFQNGWGYTEYDGYEGWVMLRYLLQAATVESP